MNFRLPHFIATCILACAASLAAADEPALSTGQTLYLPVYSHLWHGDLNPGRYPLKSQVSALISIRNTDLQNPIRLLSARYYDTNGKLLHEYQPSARIIPPMGTYELFVEKKEAAGGSGANFIIQWEATTPTNLPVVEAIHADIQGHRTLTFVTTARPIKENH